MISSPRPRSPGSRSGGRQVPSSRTVTVSTPSTSTCGARPTSGPGSAAPVGVLGGVRAGLADGDHHADPVLLAHAEPGQPAAEPAADPGQRRRASATRSSSQRLERGLAAVRDEDGDVVRPALGTADALGDRGRRARPRRRPRARPGACSTERETSASRSSASSGTAGAAGDRAVGEQHERRALLEDVLGDLGGRRPGRLPSGGRGRAGEERRPAVGVHDQRRRVAGGAVGEARRCRRRGRRRTPTRPRRRPSARRRRRGPRGPTRGRGVAQRASTASRPAAGSSRPAAGTPCPTASPTTSATRPAPSGTASYQSPPAARADDGPVVAARQPQVGQHRQGRRQQGELRLLHHVGRACGHSEVSVAAVVGLEHEQHAGAAGHRMGRSDRRSPCGPVGRPAAPQTVSGRPVRSTSSTTSATGRPSTQRQVAAGGAERRAPGRSPRPARPRR